MTIQQAFDNLGKPDRVRGSGILYYEYDLANGGAVLIVPEPPFRTTNRIQAVTCYRSTKDIPLAP